MSLRARKRNNPAESSLDDTNEKRKSRMDDEGGTPVVPTPILFVIVIVIIGLGFLKDHYQRSRARDPFAGRKIPHPLQHEINQQKNPVKHTHPQPPAAVPPILLTPQEDADLEYHENQRYHLIFSTDCSPYQHWQSFLVYYTALKVRQPGHVTRIASGCEGDDRENMQTWFDTHVQHMSKRFHLHLTPYFSGVTNEDGEVVGDYKFYNKPFGLKHWLENFSMLEFKDESHGQENDIVVLIDPDMALLRPIVGDFSSERETVISPKRLKRRIAQRVEHGKPFAQTYGLGIQWQKFDLDKIAGADSPAKEVNAEDGRLYYPVGPPYLGTVRDMYQISLKWTEFVPRVHDQYPYLLAEMYAFCIAAAHLKLPFSIIDSLMISNTESGGEGWPLVDQIPRDQMCEFAASPDHSQYAVPSVAHLCQRYSVCKEWFFGKRRIPHDIYECSTPLFVEPPSDLATLCDYKWPPNAKEKKEKSPVVMAREAFMVCFNTRLLNEAAIFYKQHACTEDTVNLKRERTVADLFRDGGKHGPGGNI